MPNKGWRRRFEDPIPLDRGRQLVTLEDAAKHILTLGDREAKAEHWKAAGEALIMAAEDRGPVMHARIGIAARVEPRAGGSSGAAQAGQGL